MLSKTKAIANLLTPPLITRAIARAFAPPKEPAKLFDGDGRLFEQVVPTAKVYGEYGVGMSTDWVIANTAFLS